MRIRAASLKLVRLSALLAFVLLALPAQRTAAQTPNAVGLILSVERYDSPSIAKLEFAANDAREMRSVMERVLGVPASNFVSVVAPTFNSFQSVFGLDGNNRFVRGNDSDLKALVRRVANGRTDGRVYVYLNAHGLPDRGVGTAMLLPQDANPASSRGYGVPLKEIEAALKALKAELVPDGEVILFIEACFSGYAGEAQQQVVPSTSFGPVAVDDTPDPAPSITILRAAEGNQTAFWDRQKKRGVFTEAILQGLTGLADRPVGQGRGGDADGQVTLKELAAFIQDVVPERLAANSHPVGGQRPVVRGRPEIILANLSQPGVQDGERAEAMRREGVLCQRLSRSGTLNEIRDFEASCAYCRRLCGSSLSERRARLVDEEADCEADKWRFERAEREKDVGVLRSLIEEATCASVKQAAQTTLALFTKPADPCAGERDALAGLGDDASEDRLRQLLLTAKCPDVTTALNRRLDDMRLAVERDRSCARDRETLADIPEQDLDSLLALRGRNPCVAIEAELSRRIQRARDLQLSCATDMRRAADLERSGDSQSLRDLMTSAGCSEARRAAEAAFDRVRRATAENARCDADKRQLASLSAARVEDLARLAATSACPDVSNAARTKWRAWLPSGRISADAVQRALGWTGDLDAAFDGEFGPKSQQALAAWQARNSVAGTYDYTSMQDVDLARLLRDAERERVRYGYSVQRDRHTGLSWGVPANLMPTSGTAENRADGTRVARYQAVSGSPQIVLLRGRGHVRADGGRPTLDLDPKLLKRDFEVSYRMTFECWWVMAERPYGAFCLGQDERRQLYIRYRVVRNELIGFTFRIDQTEPHLRPLMAVFSDDWAKNNPMPY